MRLELPRGPARVSIIQPVPQPRDRAAWLRAIVGAPPAALEPAETEAGWSMTLARGGSPRVLVAAYDFVHLVAAARIVLEDGDDETALVALLRAGRPTFDDELPALSRLFTC